MICLALEARENATLVEESKNQILLNASLRVFQARDSQDRMAHQFDPRCDLRPQLYFKYLSDLRESAPISQRFGSLLKQAGFVLPADFANRYVKLKPADWSGRMDFITVLAELADVRGR